MSIFMNYDGIKGECADSNHEEWLDLESIQWGVDRRITSATSTQNDRESANAEISDLIVTRRMDSATPNIFMETCCGTGKDVVIHLTKTGSGSGTDTYMEYTLKNALMSHYSVNANSQETGRPSEQITISFVDLEVKYTPHDEDGNALAAVAVGFDTATNNKR
ncbi:Hcp family type VI secretion system effector [Alkalilimnicola sp. S0819]|uniref:Hcp family type VI secretion system effector n=1 Tax=Alkalilimnicola sp. S0819 TaxID=2613922 RepID=UPI001261E49F|nr:type VI secretion system tube protein Hcp [Alkalilimnicola sp. S0819]KAB7622595.1 type VI secretion system tube protein Hcp [Alkalilimnicola sp. S0819]MPQ17485.1 Hcp1 family type VI secretion system effector [Alkalilimnicola sp. S0819]